MYDNYGYGYYGGNEGAAPEMRRRLDAMQRQQRYNQPMAGYGMQQVIAGRIVTGIEEARAAQIPLDGTMVYFPAPNERKIYVKSVNLDGQPVFEVYEMATGREKKTTYADSTTVNELRQRIDRLELVLMKGVGGNVHPDANVNEQPAGVDEQAAQQ